MTRDRTIGRVITFGLAGSLLVCGLGSIEAWPLSGFRLFSALRTAEPESIRVELVDGDGGHAVLPVDELGPAYAGWPQIAGSFERTPREDQLAICAAYLDAVADIGRPAVAVRFTAIRRHLDVRLGARSISPDERPLIACTADRIVGLP